MHPKVPENPVSHVETPLVYIRLPLPYEVMLRDFYGIFMGFLVKRIRKKFHLSPYME